MTTPDQPGSAEKRLRHHHLCACGDCCARDRLTMTESAAQLADLSDACQTPQCGHAESEHLSAAAAGILRQGRTCRWRNGDSATATRCYCIGYRGWKP